MTARLRLWAALAWFLAMFNFSVASADDGTDPDDLFASADCCDVSDMGPVPAPEPIGRHRHSDLF